MKNICITYMYRSNIIEIYVYEIYVFVIYI